MKRFLLGVAAMVVALVVGGSVQASGHHDNRGNFSGRRDGGSYDRHDSRHDDYHDYHLRYGTKFEHGWYYRGHDHNHWSSKCWSSRYSCWCYSDPCTSCDYYWCQPDNCYYPMTYCPYSCYSW